MKILHRMRVLMALIQEMGGDIPEAKLPLYLFLYCHEYMNRTAYYHFIPQMQGPVSLQALEDKRSLTHRKILKNSMDWIAEENIERFAVPLDVFEKMALQRMKNQWHGKGGEALGDYIKAHYPEQYFSSAIVEEISAPVFYTIGYEGRSLEEYLNTLRERKIRLLCDVRKNSFSQKYGFSKEVLKSSLESVGIEYCHLPELGIVSEKRQKLETEKDYIALFDEYEKETLKEQGEKILFLLELLKKHKRIAITCFEANVRHCHRSRVAEALRSMEGFCYKLEHL